MFQNNNDAVIRHISKVNFKNNKMRNRFAGAVIALAAFLLTLASTFGYNAAMELKNLTHYQALFENVDAQIVERIKTNPDIEAYGINQQAGMVKNENISLSLLCTDEKTMELSNVRVGTGSMPQNVNQIAIEKGYLDSVHSTAQIGDAISLNYRNDVSKEMQEGSFIVTGFLETGAKNDMGRKTYNAIVSQAFIDSDPALSSAYPSVVITVTDAAGYSNEGLKTKIKEIGQAVGLTEQSVIINTLNIDSNNTSSETAVVVFALALVIVVACTLVIYNIFYIAIMRKVNEYGLLRTIGTTPRQIKKIIFCEGRILSGQYIPVGILAGCGASYAIRPSMWLAGPSLIFAFCAGCITLFTVMLSLRKPAKIAGCVSPLEAVRYTGYYTGMRKKKRTSERLTPVSLGRMYLTRNRKKTVITFLSLTLSGILFITAASLVSSADSSKRAEQRFPYSGEYLICLNSDILSPSTSYSDLQIDNPLSDNLKAKIASISGVDGIEVHKYIRSRLEGVNIDDGITGIDNIREKDGKEFEKYLVEGTLPDSSLEGNKILVNCATSTYEYLGLHYRHGDKITMKLFDGEAQIEKEFAVSGVIENKNIGETFFLPDQVMDELMTHNCNMSFEIISGQGYSAEVEAQLKAFTASEEKLEFISMKEQTDLYQNAFHTMAIAIYAFIALIACFGLVNLVNTIITNILSRKNEIGILQAVGLSKGQLFKMLNTENAYLIFGSFIVSVFIGSGLGYIICRAAGNTGGLSYIQYQFPFLMIAVYFVLIASLQAITTKLIGSSMQKQSVIQRLQEV